MATFRIFTNDRGKQKGVFKYSAFREIEANSASAAERIAERRFGPFAYRGEHGPLKAIEWPAETPQSREWLARHV